MDVGACVVTSCLYLSSKSSAERYKLYQVILTYSSNQHEGVDAVNQD